MKVLFFLLVLVSFNSWAGVCDFPKNSFYISEIETTGIDKTAFRQLIYKAKKLYSPVVAKRGAKLEINDMWSDGEVNAQAYREGDVWHVDAFGGLARFSGMTAGGYALVLCHELGHHLGGRPKYDNGTSWASVEGQSDYYGARRCVKAMGYDADAAGLVLARVLARLSGELTMPRPDTPDTSKVWRTYEGHPAAQCRLDTYRAGKRAGDRPRCWYGG